MPLYNSIVTEACPVCDTLWRLYAAAEDNLHTLVDKHGDARGRGDRNTFEILSHELTIAESAVRSVRRELRRHEVARHGDRPDDRKRDNARPDERKPENRKPEDRK
jgi:hypothetical protein